ncbi:MAG: RIP metalloprotease RseP [Myxococcota bacterium]
MNILAAVALIAILVFIHEFGHYIVAKMCGVHVKIFSLGYGQRVVGFVHNGTDYRISLLPFGGYVLMAGADPFGYGDEDDDLLDDPSRAFMRRPVWQRFLIIAAGPAMNLVLPIVVFTTLFMAGEPQPAPVVGSLSQGSPAQEAGMQAGDTLVEIDGQAVSTWRGMGAALSALGLGTHTIVIEREEARIPLSVTLEPDDAGSIGISFLRPASIVGVDDPASPAGAAGVQTGDLVLEVNGADVADFLALEEALSAVGDTATLTVQSANARKRTVELVRSDWRPHTNGVIDSPAQDWGLLPATIFVANVGETAQDAGIEVFSGCRPGPAPPPTPALENGILDGDRYFRLDGVPIADWTDVTSTVAATMQGEGADATARPMTVELIRDGGLVTLEITPKVIRDTNLTGEYYYRPILGTVRGGDWVEGPSIRQYYPFGVAVRRATEETIQVSGLIVTRLGQLITGEAAVDKSLGGPVEIVRQASTAAEKGVFSWARLMALLSISLGIVNLVPVPVLDGGQILFFLMEAIRGRPVSHTLRERAQQLGVLFLVALMMMVLVFDIHRLFEG